MVTRIEAVPKLPERAGESHKGTFGTVLVVAGSAGMLGAAILCSRGALRGGAGLVRCALPTELMAPFTVAVPSATTADRQARGLAELCDDVDVVVCGPGLSTDAAARATVETLLEARGGKPIVLDADALNVLAPLARAIPGGGPIVITPHPGEAARLLGSDARTVQSDRERAVVELARRSDAIAVLKGAGTLVCAGDRVFRNTTGNPGLATGGSGDVLTGLLGALLAQGMAPFDAARLGVHVHGAAGDLVAARLSQAGLSSEDLPLAIAEVLAQW